MRVTKEGERRFSAHVLDMNGKKLKSASGTVLKRYETALEALTKLDEWLWPRTDKVQSQSCCWLFTVSLLFSLSDISSNCRLLSWFSLYIAFSLLLSSCRKYVYYIVVILYYASTVGTCKYLSNFRIVQKIYEYEGKIQVLLWLQLSCWRVNIW